MTGSPASSRTVVEPVFTIDQVLPTAHPSSGETIERLFRVIWLRSGTPARLLVPCDVRVKKPNKATTNTATTSIAASAGKPAKKRRLAGGSNGAGSRAFGAARSTGLSR